jgi:hypothetical protein
LQVKSIRGNRLAALLTSILIVVGLTAVVTSTVAGADSGAGASAGTGKKKKKKKVCKPGTHKVVVKKKNGKKKKKCVADPPAGPTTLSLSPATFTFPDTEHGQSSAPQAFTVTNSGAAPSGVPTASITETSNPIPGDPPGFVVSANGCTAALPAGASCTVSVEFRPTSNANPQPYTAVLHVTASPGSDAQAALTGTAD